MLGVLGYIPILKPRILRVVLLCYKYFDEMCPNPEIAL
jgi:hypothetical protein